MMGASCLAKGDCAEFSERLQIITVVLPFPSSLPQTPYDANLLWELLWVSSGPLGSTRLWAPYNKEVAGAAQQK